MTSAPSFYEILGLSPDTQHDSIISASVLRNAYRRALLQNHPDKSSPLTGSSSSRKAKYTVDQISEAFSVLGNAKARSKYDADFKLQQAVNDTRGNGAHAFQTGVEVVDLDDLLFDEEEHLWHRSCRCGQERGFEVREQDLEDSADEGEVSVGCKGCSLWMRVLFGVVEEDVEDRPVHKG